MISTLAALALASATSAAAAPAMPPISYELTPVGGAHQLEALQVSLHFTMGPRGFALIDLPKRAGGARDLREHIRDIHVTGGQATGGDGPAALRVEATPGAVIALSYHVVSAYQDTPGPNQFNTYEPVVLPSWFWAYGEALFASIEGQENDPAHFEWRGDKPVPFASTLKVIDRPLTETDVLRSVSVGGDAVRVSASPVGGVTTAVIGRFGFSDDAFQALAGRIASVEDRFWGQTEPFFVTLAALKEAQGLQARRGEGRAGGFAMMSSNFPLQDLKAFLAHEYFHRWNPFRLGGMEDGPDQVASYWFSEGFTDYYARKLLLSGHIFSPAEFMDDWNDALSEYTQSPVKGMPNSAIIGGFRSNPDLERLPYLRGALFAALADSRLQAATHGRLSLDDVLRKMRDLGPADPRIATQRFLDVADQLAGVNLHPDFDKYIVKGEPINLPSDGLGSCFRVKSTSAAPYDPGFDLVASSATGVFTGVRPESAAFRAGLRDGMRLVRREAGRPGDSRVTLVYRVTTPDGHEQIISYTPAGAGSVLLPEVEAAPCTN
jgi:predicted metalloprotease with PDZ domain